MKRMWKILLGLSLLAYALCLSPMVHAGIRIVHRSLYVIAVGINKYQERSFPPLKYATADAQEFANAMQRLWPGAAVTKLVLLDETATRDSIEAAFNRVILKAGPYDTFVFHYAGMGFHRKARFIKGASEFFLYPSDFVDSEDEKSPSFRGISSTLIQTWCSKIQARNQLIVLDACDSGEDFNTFTSRVIGQSGGLSELLGKSVLILGTSGITGESEELGHGHLTSALLQGLHGEGDYDPKDGTITAKELESYFYSRYAQLAIASHLNGRPASFSVGSDFMVGRLAVQNCGATSP